jgi:DNA-binding LacI/PurR family transcriptional regulator
LGKQPTIRDVAKKAGVSTATVSFVLNKHRGEAISERVRKRVLAAARALDYHPSAAAAGLARKRTRNVAIIFYRDEDLISNQFYSFVVQGAIKEAMDQDYNLLFSYIKKAYKGYSDLPKIVREKNTEGVVFMRMIDPKIVRAIQARGIFVVAIDHYPEMKGVDSLHIDNRTGGHLAAEHLIELEHERLAMLIAAADRPSISERLEGFRQGLKEHGLIFNRRSNLFAARSLTFEGGYQAALKLLQRKQRPTALFCANDEMAAGAVRAAHELGLEVPKDLSVVGFDDITMADYTDPPLTTVGVVKEFMGRRAIARLLERVEGADSQIKQEVVPVRLVLRQSTSHPAKHDA